MRIRRIGFVCLIIDINNVSPFPLQTPSLPLPGASAINRLATSGNRKRIYIDREREIEEIV